MKKAAIAFVLAFLLLGTTAANAICVPSEAGPYTGSSQTAQASGKMTAKPQFTVPLKYSDRLFHLILTCSPEFPFEQVFDLVENDPEHISYCFYTSMGCEDITCTDAAHTHWCPDEICQNPDHGHSASEYREAAKKNPTCPCHG